MNFSKSILTVAMLVSVSAASAKPVAICEDARKAPLFTKAKTVVANFVDEAAFAVNSNAKAVWTKVPSYNTVKNTVVNAADEASFVVTSNAKAVWAKVPSRTEVSELVAAKSYDVKQVVAPYMTKKVAAVAAAAGVVTTGTVVAYKKGYFGKAAQAVVNFGSAVKAKFTSKK